MDRFVVGIYHLMWFCEVEVVLQEEVAHADLSVASFPRHEAMMHVTAGACMIIKSLPKYTFCLNVL